MAGTTPLSLVQQFDSTGAPLAGGLLTFFVAGTVATKQNAFQDFGLTVPLSNPLTLDSTGRVPQHWLADGLIHIRLTDSAGLVYVDTTMQVLGPSSGGGGGGGTVDPTALIATGDLKHRYGTGPLSGYARANGLTIGNAGSGATERANADTQALFIYPNLVVSGGRTGNALNDYNASKTIELPDLRGRTIAGLGDMGAPNAARLTSAFFGPGTVLGTAGGAESNTLTAAQIPAHLHPITDRQHQHGVPVDSSGSGTIPLGGSTGSLGTGNTNFAFTGITSTDNSTGGGSAHPNVQPTMLMTIYIKL
jgi:microcystin-dependent protein